MPDETTRDLCPYPSRAALEAAMAEAGQERSDEKVPGDG